MAKQNQTLLYVGLAALAWYGYRKFKLYQGLQFGFAGIGVKTDPFRITVRMAMDNTTGVTARLDGITGSIYQPDGMGEMVYVAQVSYNKQTVIAPYNRTLITLEIYPDVLGVLQAIYQYKLPFRFVGSAMIDGFPVKIDMEYKFDLRLPDFLKPKP